MGHRADGVRPWLFGALLVYAVVVAATSGALAPAARGSGRRHCRQWLVSSYLVRCSSIISPSNIGGDVIRIRDSSRDAGSMTLATTVVLVDRALGLIALVLIAASGASLAAGGGRQAALPILPAWLWAGFFLGAGVSAPAVLAPTGFGRMLQPLRVFHPEWIDNRIAKLTTVLSRFREKPAALAACFGGAVFVQAATVAFYFAVAHAADRHWAVGLGGHRSALVCDSDSPCPSTVSASAKPVLAISPGWAFD